MVIHGNGMMFSYRVAKILRAMQNNCTFLNFVIIVFVGNLENIFFTMIKVSRYQEILG